jgi:restriction system protein
MPRIKPLALAAGAARSLGALWSALRRGEETPGKVALRLKLDTRRWNAELLKQLEWRRFEELCAAYYEAAGYTARIGQAGPEGGGVDIVLEQKGGAQAARVARCKAWGAYRVGVKSVREVRRSMTAARLHSGILLTSGRFTQDAVNLAAAEGVELVDGAALLGRIAALPPEKALGLLQFATQGDFLTPTCPRCSIKMTLRQSTGEGRKFWGCRNYPACKQTFAGTPANTPD